MLEKVIKNKFGFYELRNKPTAEEQQKDFEEEYYQNEKAGYESAYTPEALEYFQNKEQQKEIAIKKVWTSNTVPQILDIGCGEGFFMKYFYEKGCKVTGIDFSKYAMEHNNPELLPYLKQGDCYQILGEMIAQNIQYDIVNMDSVLDMVQDQTKLLKLIKQVLKTDGILCCKVGNNYSDYQLNLLKKGVLSKEYWLDEEGHTYYFNKDGFIRFMQENGYFCKDIYAEGLIELNLMNELTNYYENPAAGKSCYKAKLNIENMLHELSSEKTNEIMRLFGSMGLGRELVGIFQIA